MKQIYIVLTNTGTVLSKIIKTYTKDEFTHVSLALDEELREMYSFGRLNPYNPFIGGFIHEYIDKGTFKRFYNTKAKVCKLSVEDEQYEKIKENINHFHENKDKYKFNVTGLFAISINKKIQKKDTFYCAEFIKSLLEDSKVVEDLPELIRPQCFNEIKNKEEVYSGLLREYPIRNIENKKEL